MDRIRVARLKVLLFISSIICLVYLLLSAFDENFTAEWRVHQRTYARRLSEEARDAGTPAGDYPIEIRQVYLEEWGRVDRCVTCHVCIDDPACANEPQPLTAHPGNILKRHPSDKFACTICHQGQGRATDKNAAHGHVPFWDEPLLSGDFVQATCTKCHHGEQVPRAPVLSRGRQLLHDLGCAGCHRAGTIVEKEKAGPRLTTIGSKVSRKWLEKWLANPKDYLPKGKMPRYRLSPAEVNALAAYLKETFRSKAIDEMPDPKGDYDTGATVYREAQCIVCHVTKLDYEENPIGGEIGPNLLRIGNKVRQRWLVTFLKNPHSFLPYAKMPGYNFSDQEAQDLSQFIMEEWTDYDLVDAEEQEPEPPPATPEQIKLGRKLFAYQGCSGCHDLTPDDANPGAPDLTFIGSTPVHQLTFGDAEIPHTVPDFLYAKLTSPRSLHHRFELPPGEQPAVAIWRDLNPAPLFSGSLPLSDGSEEQQLAWILGQVQQAGLLPEAMEMPAGSVADQTQWLVQALDQVDAFNPLKMPNFELSDEDAEALTIALMSLSEVSAPSKRYEVPMQRRVVFNPKDEFGELQRHYRCLSCHKIRDSGDLLASDLTYEGNRVNRQWLYHFLVKPYSMRRMLTIAMPIFHFSDDESRLMADYMSNVFVDSQFGTGWKRGRDRADPRRGKELFDAKGCIACHQVNGAGGDVGPSLTTQVPEFPHGTWVGDKLKGAWVYQWLKNPQSVLPDTIEPNLKLSDDEALDLTAYLLTLKSPDFQKNAQPQEEK